MYTVKHVVPFLPFLLVLLILWRSLAGQVAGLTGPLDFVSAVVVRNVLLSVVVLVLAIFVFRIVAYLNTEYGVTNKRLIMKKEAAFRLTVAEIPTDRIESIYCYQGLFGHIFRYGTIGISGVGGSMMPVFEMVRRPYALRRKIVDIIEKNKTITVVHGDLPRPHPQPVVEPQREEEPIYRYGTFVRVLEE